MPTANPRINVTLSPSLDALVSRLARLQRVSKASVLRELLETTEPQLAQVAALMEAADKARVNAKHNLSADMSKAVEEVIRDANILTERALGLSRDLVSEAEGIRGRRPARRTSAGSARAVAGQAKGGGGVGRGGRKRKDPPASNRGVKS